mgnify:CR=1 FL=1
MRILNWQEKEGDLLLFRFLKGPGLTGKLYRIEKGDPAVTFGAYFNVLRVLGLQDDLLKIAADDEFGRKLQDLELLSRKLNG